MRLELREDDGSLIGIMPVAPKTFSTGSRGFAGQGKIAMTDGVLQCSCNLVLIGSKPTATDDKTETPTAATQAAEQATRSVAKLRAK